MRHEKINPAYSFGFEGEKIAKPRYTLTTALLIVRAIETSSSRGAVFAEIIGKNPFYRLVDAMYVAAGKKVFQPLVLFLYMLKCVTSLDPFNGRSSNAVSVTNFVNESRAVSRLASMLPHVSIACLTLRRRNVLRLSQLGPAVRLLGAAPRIWPFLLRIAGAHSFMPSARMASALAFYIRFGRVFDDSSGLKAAIIASNYSPEAVGLAAAAHNCGRSVIYVNHAPVPAKSAVVPQVLADCAALYGDAIRRVYESRSRCLAEVVLIGQPGETRPMTWRDEIDCVGIFLTALTRPEAIEDLVQKIRATRPKARILIRNHPVPLLKTDLAALAANYGDIDVTIGVPLEEEIAACDIVFCGNSGVTMNVLRGGRPVAYSERLDGLPFDYNGFVESGLAFHASEWSLDLYRKLFEFYDRPAWRDVMRSYDSSYQGDRAELQRSAAARIESYIIH